MRRLNQILGLITGISVLVGILSTMQGMKHKKESLRLENNLYSKTIEYNDELGRKVTEVTQLQVSLKELKEVSKKDSATLNNYEKTLLHISKELANSDRKLRNVESSSYIKTESSVDLATKMTDTVINRMPIKIATVKDRYGEYRAEYNPATDSLLLNIVQRNEIFLDIFREREKKPNGKDAFILIRWLKPWVYKASVKSLNDSTVIKEFQFVNIKKNP